MTAAHTPGPWLVKGRVHSSGEAVRIESHHPSDDHHLYQICDVLDANGYSQNSANLALIAAAPDLLEALILLEREMVESGNAASIDFGWKPAIEKTRAAIAKATGSAP